MQGYIRPPLKIGLFLRLLIKIADKVTGKKQLSARLLAHFPKAFWGSLFFELFAPHGPKDMNSRLLKLVRLQSSATAGCPFCLDMNAQELNKVNIGDNELKCIISGNEPKSVASFSPKEILALKYARVISSTPVNLDDLLISEMKKNFAEREILILANVISQVNYWSRFNQALGIPPAGFSDVCERFNSPLQSKN